MMQKTLLVSIFIFVCITHGIWFTREGMLDSQQWGNQAYYVETGDTREFDATAAYGHPGGPLIIGTSITHAVTQLPYEDSLFVFLTLFDALAITLICRLCFALRRDWLWPIVTAVVLVMHPVYPYTTPPSLAASLLFVLLALYTLYIYGKEAPRTRHLAVWGLLAGILVATRADIGTASALVFGIVLLCRIPLRRMFIGIATAFGTFIALDPFMWFMPVRHMADLAFKLEYHYSEITILHLPASVLLTAAAPACLSILLCIALMATRKGALGSVPVPFMGIMLAFTALLTATFLTANYQALRYFQPLFFFWETMLTLFVFTLITQAESRTIIAKNQKLFRIGIALLLITGPLSLFILRVL